MLQCGWKYGFGEIKGDKRATKLYKFTPEQLAGLPTNNIPGDREFSVFDM